MEENKRSNKPKVTKPSSGNAAKSLGYNKDTNGPEANLWVDGGYRALLAIGFLALFITLLCLYLVDHAVYNNYHPDIKSILDKALPLTIEHPENFAPEPVERVQYQLALLTIPIVAFFSLLILRQKLAFFRSNSNLCAIINYAGIVVLLAYTYYMLQQPMLWLPDAHNTDFFSACLYGKFNALIMTVIYTGIAYGLMLLMRSEGKAKTRLLIDVTSWIVIGFVLVEVVLYNLFNLSTQTWGRLMETNAVFYSVTQVFAGKSLLVDINAQYGLYAWVLAPIMKLTGLSIFKFSLIMGLLNALSFLFIYLGIRRLMRYRVLGLVVFLALIFWVYWLERVNYEETPRFYYQYMPIRIFFPAMAFYLLTIYQMAGKKWQSILLPLLGLASSLAIFWNLDSGIVVFGAVLLSLIYTSIDTSDMKKSIKDGIIRTGIMLAMLTLTACIFILTTKIKSGHFPDFSSFIAFQQFFYVSGFFMLPMGVVQFWNIPAIVYVAASVYSLYFLTDKSRKDGAVVFFLFILGGGLFVWFQGRSYDRHITTVIFPVFIIAGIFIDRIVAFVIKVAAGDTKLFKYIGNEGMLLCLFPIIVLTDGALSMICNIPQLQSYTIDQAFYTDEKKEVQVKSHIDFVKDNLRDGDTVLILSKDYESYYYALKHYYNPLPLPGSTEIMLKSEIVTLLDYIRSTKYPVIYEPIRPWAVNDTIVKVLSENMYIKNKLADQTMLFLKPDRQKKTVMLPTDGQTVYYNCYGDFDKYLGHTQKLNLPENFEIELIVKPDGTRLAKNNLMFTNVKDKPTTCGLLMTQFGDSLNNYVFTYGSGSGFVNGVNCKLNVGVDNRILIKVSGNQISVFNNSMLCGQTTAPNPYINSDGPFVINGNYAGTVEEIRIERK